MKRLDSRLANLVANSDWSSTEQRAPWGVTCTLHHLSFLWSLPCPLSTFWTPLCSSASLPSDSRHQLGPLSDWSVQVPRNSLDWLPMKNFVPFSPRVYPLCNVFPLSFFTRDPQSPPSVVTVFPFFLPLKSDFISFIHKA